jgi:hypothetical protein
MLQQHQHCLRYVIHAVVQTRQHGADARQGTIISFLMSVSHCHTYSFCAYTSMPRGQNSECDQLILQAPLASSAQLASQLPLQGKEH